MNKKLKTHSTRGVLSLLLAQAVVMQSVHAQEDFGGDFGSPPPPPDMGTPAVSTPGNMGHSNSGAGSNSKDGGSGPLAPAQKDKFAKAAIEDITDANFPEIIESFDFPNADIQDIVKAISELTGKNFIIDNGLRGKITILAPS